MHSENRRTDAVDKVLIFIRQYRHYYGNRRLWYVIAPVAVLALAASLMTFGEEEKTGSWTPVRFGTFEVDLTESGDIRAVNSYNIDAPMEWRVDLQITDMVPEGTIVKEGDFLVQFDTSALEEDLVTALDQLKAQEAELLSVQTKQQSQLSQYDSDLKIAEYSRESSQLQLDLLKFESEVRKEDARLSYQKALISFDETTTKIKNQKIINEAEMNQVLHILDYRRKRVKDMKQRLENLTLRAPIGGMVVYNEIGGWRGTPKHKIAIGESVWPRMTVVKIPDLSEMESVIRVNEIDADKVKIGQKTTLRLDAFEERLFTGEVQIVAPIADRAQSSDEDDDSQNIKDYEVVVRIDESDNILKPGMSARTRIVIDEAPDSYFVPIGAVFEKNGEPVVYTKRSYPKPVSVTLGKRNNRFIIIRGDVRNDDEVTLTAPEHDAMVLGWFADMQQKTSEKETLLGHIETMEEEKVADRIVEQAKQIPKELPQQFQRLADMLAKAGKPLTDEQIAKLSKMNPESAGQQGMQSILTEEQMKIISGARANGGGRESTGGSPQVIVQPGRSN